MKRSLFLPTLLALVLALGLAACDAAGPAADASDPVAAPGSAQLATADDPARDSGLNKGQAVREANTLVRALGQRTGIKPGELRRNRFTAEENVFVRSTLALENLEDPDRAAGTFPLYKGLGPAGDAVYYIITEASDFTVAKKLGVNYAPKLIYARGSGGDQAVTLEGGIVQFKGAVDFSPVRRLEAGDGPFAFPPSVAEPGAVADEEWSSAVVLPSGLVINAQVIANDTGLHDRVVRIDPGRDTVTLQLLDGFQGGDQFYYHLVTDSSDPVAATIELGVYAPRLANLPTFGQSTLDQPSALLGFSPNVNGETGAGNPERQGLNSTIVDDDRDPINVFPIDPDNNRRLGNNYSPMWDAHLNAWTDEAIAAGERRRITSFADLEALVAAGLVTSFVGSPGPENPFVAGLRNSGALINCPVIAQPFEKVGG